MTHLKRHEKMARQKLLAIRPYLVFLRFLRISRFTVGVVKKTAARPLLENRGALNIVYILIFNYISHVILTPYQ